MTAKQVQLSELSEFRNGKFISAKERVNNGHYPVFGSNGIIGKCNKILCEQPVIVIGRAGSSGTVLRTNSPSWISDNCIISTPKKNTDFNFLFYNLKYLNLPHYIIGTSQPLLTQDILNSIETTKFQFEEQQKIGKTLSDLDTKIENLQNQNKILEQTAQAIFKSWFVDFDGVTEFEDSELGQIPKGWSVEKLGDQCHIVTGKLNSNAASDDGEYSFFTCAKENFKTNTYSFDCEAILLAGNNAMGDFSAKYFSGKFDVYQRTYVITIKNSKSLGYFYLLLSIKKALEYFQSISFGTATRYLTMTILEPFPIIIPDEDPIKKFNKITNPILKQIVKNDSELETLTKTRDVLLPKLMSGEIRV